MGIYDRAIQIEKFYILHQKVGLSIKHLIVHELIMRARYYSVVHVVDR